jgi:antitoxin ParD1/3/4
MPTRNVVVTEHQAKLIEELVRSGRYQNASEVLREGLRLVERQMAEDAAKLKALREAVELGERSFETEGFVTLETDEDYEKFFAGVLEEALAGIERD